MLRENVDASGKLITDKILRAVLQYRNTPDPDTKLSPAEVIFGRKIKDFLPIPPGKYHPQEGWRLDREAREKALRTRYCRGYEKWSEHTKQLKPLMAGDKVLVQNQSGTPKIAKRWDRSGTVLEVGDYDKFKVKIDGSGRVTERNRRFLRKLFPHQVTQLAPGNAIELSPRLDTSIDLRPAVSVNPRLDVSDALNAEMPSALEPTEQDVTGELPRGPVEELNVENPVEQTQPITPTLRRSGRERKVNTKYSASEWDLSSEN